MIYYTKKLLCYTTSVALLTSSLTPVYAGPNHYNRAQEDLSVKNHSRSRTLVLEDFPQEKTKTSANIQTWTPEFIKNMASYAYTKMSSWFEPAENAFSYDLASLKEYLAEDFSEEIEDIKTSTPNQKRLEDLQNMVWRGELSPYQYEEGLRELQSHVSETLLNAVQDQFQTTLKSYPAFLNGNFQRDLVTCLETIRSAQRKEEKDSEINNFKGILDYYKHRQNPLDYVETLKDAKAFMEVNKRTFSYQTYNDLYKAINRAIKPQDLKLYHILKATRNFTQTVLQELPYYGEDIPEGFNSSFLSNDKKAAVQRDTLSEPLSLMTTIKGIARGTYKGMKYAVEHPDQAITIGLVSQVAASAALNSQQSSPLVSRYTTRAIGEEFQINQNTTFEQFSPTVASLTNGNVFAAWLGYQSGYYDIYGRTFSADGTPLSNQFAIINQITPGVELPPAVASITNSNVFVAWDGIQTGDADIYGRIFSSSGTALSNEFRINQITNGNQASPSVASLTNGNVFIAWDGTQAGDYDIYGRIFSSSGTALSNEFRINQITNGNQASPSVACLTNGNVFVAWSGLQTGDEDIYGRIFSSSGTALSNEFGINQITNDNQFSPSVASLINGDVFVAWDGTQAGNFDIYGRIFSSTGTALSNDFSINQVTTAGAPAVASLANGNVFVAWETGANRVYGRLFSAEGTALSNEFDVNQNTINNQYPLAIVGLTNGNVFGAWTRVVTGSYGIYGLIFSVNEALTTSSSSITGTTASATTNFQTTGVTAATASPTASSTNQVITTGISSTTGASITNSQTSTANNSTTDGDISSSHRLTPSWLVSPARAIADGFKNLWNMSKSVE